MEACDQRRTNAVMFSLRDKERCTRIAHEVLASLSPAARDYWLAAPPPGECGPDAMVRAGLLAIEDAGLANERAGLAARN
jgi:hypothetical protein